MIDFKFCYLNWLFATIYIAMSRFPGISDVSSMMDVMIIVPLLDIFN